jgi:hypothetical protein
MSARQSSQTVGGGRAKLERRLAGLEKRLADLQHYIQLDSGGQSLTLKVPADISIESGGQLKIKAGATITLNGSKIKLNC